MQIEALTSKPSVRKSKVYKFNLRFTAVIFYLVFALTYVISGHIIKLEIHPYYRLGVISSFLILLIIFFPKIKTKFKPIVLLSFILLALLIFVSAIVNQSTITEILLFSRQLIYTFLILELVNIYVSSDNIKTILKICIILAIIQLPIVFFQYNYLFYRLPSSWQAAIMTSRGEATDFDFGTFVGDAALSLFLLLLIVFMLFERDRSSFIKYKWPIIFWLSITVWYAHSELSKIILIIIWIFYFIKVIRKPKRFLQGLLVLMVFWGILSALGVSRVLLNNLQQKVQINALATDDERIQAFLEGRYYKGAAIVYYLRDDINWFGDGPSRYSDVINKTKVRGNFGHHFSFYSEVGIIAWIISLWILFIIAFDGLPQGKIKINMVNMMIFLSLLILGFSVALMSNISYILISAIIAKTYLIPRVEKQREVNLFESYE